MPGAKPRAADARLKELPEERVEPGLAAEPMLAETEGLQGQAESEEVQALTVQEQVTEAEEQAAAEAAELTAHLICLKCTLERAAEREERREQMEVMTMARMALLVEPEEQETEQTAEPEEV